MRLHTLAVFSFSCPFLLLACSSSANPGTPTVDAGLNGNPEPSGDASSADVDGAPSSEAGPSGCANGWCTVPLATSLVGPLRAVWGDLFLLSGTSDSTTAGGVGQVQRVDPTGSLVPLGASLTGSIVDLGGADSTHLLGVGSTLGAGQVYSFDGASWSTTALMLDPAIGGGPLRFPFAIYAPSQAEAFLIAGDTSATPTHWKGRPSTAVDVAPAVGDIGGALPPAVLFGFAADDVWALGNAQTAQHWTGASWQSVSIGASTPCFAGSTFGTHKAVCFAEDLGKAIAFDGSAWSTAAGATAVAGVTTISVARSASGVVVLGAHSGAAQPAIFAYDGNVFSPVPFSFGDPTLQPDSVGVFGSGRIAFTAYTVKNGLIDQWYLFRQGP